MRIKLTAAVLSAGLLFAAPAQAETVKIGFLATLEGFLTALGEDGKRGFDIAIKELGGKMAGKDVEVVYASSDATPDSALRAARKLIEQDNVDILIGPLSGDEGIAIKEYSKTHPDKTFVNGVASAMEATVVDPSPNFFRFNQDAAQWMAGVGEYVYNTKGYRKIATLAEDYSFPYTQVYGLVMGFCKAGGEVTTRQWVPAGTKDFSSVIANLPDDVDAIFVGLGGADAVNFLAQYQQAGGNAKLIGGTILVDQTVLSSKGSAKEALIGTPTGGPQADDWTDPNWQAWVKRYQDAYPADQRFPTPSLAATAYYVNVMAVNKAMEAVGGDLSDGQKKFREALAKVEVDAPNGKITLDQNRQAIGSTFITEVVEGPDGNLINMMVSVTPNVAQGGGMSTEQLLALGMPSRDVPECKKEY
jgi:ABC-type branched-subunit amino acid transport system substrate-binding protein